MRSFRFSYVCGALLLAGTCVAVVACNQNVPANCPKPIGTYKPELSMIAGNCQTAFEGFDLMFDKDDPVSTMRSIQRLADVIYTEITLKGCELDVGQSVTGEGSVAGMSLTRFALAGTLGVVDENALSGTVVRTDFMEDGRTPRCTAQYEAWYTRDNLVLGAAAREQP